MHFFFQWQLLFIILFLGCWPFFISYLWVCIFGASWVLHCIQNRIYKRSRVLFLIIKLCCSRVEDFQRYFIEPIADPFEPTLLGVLYFQHECQNYSGRLYSSSKKKRATAFRGRLVRLQKPRPSKTTVLRMHAVGS